MDLSLDDVIAKTKVGRGGRTRGGRGGIRGGRGGRGGGGGGGGAGFGRGNRAGFSRAVPDGKWQHDRFEGGGARAGGGLRSPSSLNATSKLMINNLDFNVSDADIEELFGEFGPLKRASVHYDRSGRSLGTAEVSFERRVDAQRAFKQYNNVPLDGRPMKISMVGPGAVAAAAQVASNGAGARAQNGQGGRPGGRRGMGGRGAAGGRGRGRGGGTREKKPVVTVDDLDKELDAYVSKMDE